MDIDDEDRMVLDRFRTHFESTRELDTIRRCERLVKLGLMERKRQARGKLPTLYRTIDA